MNIFTIPSVFTEIFSYHGFANPVCLQNRKLPFECPKSNGDITEFSKFKTIILNVTNGDVTEVCKSSVYEAPNRKTSVAWKCQLAAIYIFGGYFPSRSREIFLQYNQSDYRWKSCYQWKSPRNLYRDFSSTLNSVPEK